MTDQRTFWDTQSDRRHPSDPIISAFTQPKIEFIAKHITWSEGSQILDVGCGNGYFTYYLEQLGKTIGLDYSWTMVKTNPSDNLVQGSALALPFKDNTFDLVFCSNLLHHIENPVLTVREMRRVSSQYIVLSEPNRNNPAMLGLGLLKKEERLSLHFTPRYVNKIAQEAGLEVITHQPMGFVTPNRMPRVIVSLLSHFNRPSPLAAYIVLVGKKPK